MALAGTSPMMIVCSPLSIFTLARRITSAPDKYTVTESTVEVAGTWAAKAPEHGTMTRTAAKARRM